MNDSSNKPPASMVVMALAKDTVGLNKMLSAIVVAHGGKILLERAVHAQGYFAVILSFVFKPRDDQHVEQIAAEFRGLEEEGLFERVSVHEANVDATSGTRRASIEVRGPDQPGILDTVAFCLESLQLSLFEVVHDVTNAAFTGAAMIEASFSVEVPEGFDEGQLEAELARIEDRFDLDVDVTFPAPINSTSR